jgi:hypothetical protein
LRIGDLDRVINSFPDVTEVAAQAALARAFALKDDLKKREAYASALRIKAIYGHLPEVRERVRALIESTRPVAEDL